MKNIYIFIFKPYDVLSQFTPELAGQRTLADLGVDFPKDAYPVGRLDADSEGLLLLTNDPALNEQLLHPKRHTPKTYWAQVEGIPDEKALQRLREGVEIRINGQTHRTRPAKAELLSEAPPLPDRQPPVRFRLSVPDRWIELTISEGKNRQVRRMCAAVGYPVLRLVRVGFGPYRLGQGVLEGLEPGTARHVAWGAVPPIPDRRGWNGKK